MKLILEVIRWYYKKRGIKFHWGWMGECRERELIDEMYFWKEKYMKTAEWKKKLKEANKRAIQYAKKYAKT